MCWWTCAEHLFLGTCLLALIVAAGNLSASFVCVFLKFVFRFSYTAHPSQLEPWFEKHWVWSVILKKTSFWYCELGTGNISRNGEPPNPFPAAPLSLTTSWFQRRRIFYFGFTEQSVVLCTKDFLEQHQLFQVVNQLESKRDHRQRRSALHEESSVFSCNEA
jgi:hypothetical protein